MNGFLLVNKPPGISSFLVVKRLRYLSKVKKIGYAGTLDPFASGLLIVALGREFTRQIDNFVLLPKTYEVRMVLGMQTNTLDSYGTLTEQTPVNTSEALISEAVESFKGTQLQTPPIFSAKKQNGQRLYALARKGIEVHIPSALITVYDILIQRCLFQEHPIIDLKVHCSKGTYIRSLVRDIGHTLHLPAYAKDLVRTAIGDYTLDQAVDYDHLTSDTIQGALRDE